MVQLYVETDLDGHARHRSAVSMQREGDHKHQQAVVVGLDLRDGPEQSQFDW